MADISSLPTVDLRYRIAKCAGHSGKYLPEHILVDTPTDPSSRWSGANQTADSNQWIILELTEPSLLRSITFGKFHKAHPCNMKEFKVYTGRSMNTLTLALHCALNNDSKPETFELRRSNEAGRFFPVCLVKIVPLSAHSPSFNISIWHVALSGINDVKVVEKAEDEYASYRETTALRHVLKYLRQRRHLTSFRALQSRTSIQLEDPLVTKIYEDLMSGNWSSVESLIQACADNALFDEYIQTCDPKAFWQRLDGASSDGDVPTPRAGHQMCIDSEAGIIYMFGGWDGQKSLDDFWAYSISEKRWKVLSHDTALNGGPGPRSCHKMVFDPLLGYIYLLGSLDDGERPRSPSPFGTVTPTRGQNGPANTSAETTAIAPPQGDVSASRPENGSKRDAGPSDFYRYTTRGPNAGTWTVLNADTKLEGGPPLIYDHQMVIDSEKQMLYVFGGLIVNGDPDTSTMKYSGLYQYNITTGEWVHILDESASSSKASRTIPSRFGHSMVFDPHRRRLVVFAGKKCESYLADMYTYDIASQEVTPVTLDFHALGGPDPCFCQRAAVDPESGDIYVLPGLLKPKTQKSSVAEGILRSTFWIFRAETSTWMQVLNDRSNTLEDDPTETQSEPQPRYAHQMVYDQAGKEFFIHGGHSGGQDDHKRLDDFWSMRLERPTRAEMVRRAKFIIRRQHFKELCETIPPVQALTFLQRDVHVVVDHRSDEETVIFRALLSHLFDKASLLHPSKESVGGDVEMTDATETLVNSSNSGSKLGEVRKSMPALPELIKDEEEDDMQPELTPERFWQRTNVFESLLELINSDAKQPATDLTDLVDVTGRELYRL